MNRILISVDGSAASDEAVMVGVDIASRFGAEVVLLHADERLVERLFDLDPAEGPSQEQLAAADPVLAAAAGKAREKGVSVWFELIGEHGASGIADGVVGVANGLEVDLIVMGSHGHGAIAGTFLGSVSRGVLEYATQPVLITKGQ